MLFNFIEHCTGQIASLDLESEGQRHLSMLNVCHGHLKNANLLHKPENVAFFISLQLYRVIH